MPGLDAIFSILSDLIKVLLSWIPMPILVNVTERGVKFVRGKPAKLMKPGLHWYVPMTTECETFSILKDATEFEPVVLTTSDGKAVAVGFVVLWHVDPDDVIQAATTCDSLEAMISDVGESLLPPLILQYSFGEVMERIRGGRKKSVNELLTQEASEMLSAYGITVDRARINFIAPARVLRLIQSHTGSG